MSGSIPVMANFRFGEVTDAEILESLEVDFVDEFGYARLLGIDDVHDHAALQHLRQADFDFVIFIFKVHCNISSYR